MPVHLVAKLGLRKGKEDDAFHVENIELESAAGKGAPFEEGKVGNSLGELYEATAWYRNRKYEIQNIRARRSVKG